MHAIQLHEFGPADNLRHESIPDPEPGRGQVRIAVAAAGVHLVDTALRRGEPGPFPVPELPTVPGREVAGVVDRVGDGVDASLLGTRVVAHLGTAPGGYAELTVTEAERLLAVPEGVSFAAAVAMVGTGRTTLGILQFTELDADSVAVVTAAAGGIGTLLVQYAAAVGATVVGLAGGPDKVAMVRDNGADIAVDYTLADWPEKVRAQLGGRTATVVFDGVGGQVADAAVDRLGPGGTHLVFGWSAGAPTQVDTAARGITSPSVLGPAMVERAGGDLRILSERALTAAGTGLFRPALTEFPLAEAAAAHQALESRATTGKVVLIP
ncbi:zinc-binding dehydrogenase [Nocardia sp. XZ_19_231]|uniref:zinc-binding dehydrogenase n=1 Tax=Nocardia sp. XZ_19_231 TaxID=2769252 RepID=UPI0018903983|nr:zinc-binding dehydrogenase [Nocardia sp. XZ_19_231]